MITQEQTAMLEQLAMRLSKPPRLPVLRTPDEVGLTYEEVSFKTEDGLELSAWYMPGTPVHVILSNHFFSWE